jgi:hypothetical protein
MKTQKTLLAVLFTILVLNVAAQDRNYHFGLHCSPNLSWIKPDVEEVIYKSDGTLIGVSYGGIFENNFTPNVGIITGINVIHTGGQLKYPYVQEAGTALADTGVLWRKYKLQYIEIPLMLKGSTGELLGKFSFFGKFGVGSGFNIRAKADDEFLSDSNPGGEKTVVENKNVKKDISFFRESLIIGIGAEYRLGKTAIAQMGLTFSNGFTDILTEATTYKPTIKEKARSNFVELNIGIMF